MTLLSAFLISGFGMPAAAPAPQPVPITAPVHCQVPCGIYGDKLRVDMLREHATTIEKAMQQIEEIGAADKPNWNQLVRWVTTKEDHAQKIQDQVGDYWLAQRIKMPAEGAHDRYIGQLVQAHGILTSAMKCKQTTDLANLNALRAAIDGLEAAYFTEEDLKHLKEHKHDAHEHDDHQHGDHDHPHEHDKKKSDR